MTYLPAETSSAESSSHYCYEPPTVVTIETNYNPYLKANQFSLDLKATKSKTKTKLSGKSKAELKAEAKKARRTNIFESTERQRHWAAQAKPFDTVEGLKRRLCKQFSSPEKGYRAKPSTWSSISRKTHDGKCIRINDMNGLPLLISCPTMPDNLRQGVLEHIDLIFPGALKHTDTASEGINNTFEALHFTWYNRFSEQGHRTDPMQDPATIVRDGRTQPVNMAQKVPRMSAEDVLFGEQYLQLQAAMEQVFEWLSETLQQLLPGSFDLLSATADILPSGAVSPVYPFTGFVINFNVSTRIHRDWKDHDICLVMPLIEKGTQGGHICIKELGLVIEMESLDALFFSSSKLSHFNLHFVGRRASFVFHSDSASKQWAQDRNGWDQNVYMTSSSLSQKIQKVTASNAHESDSDDGSYSDSEEHNT